MAATTQFSSSRLAGLFATFARRRDWLAASLAGSCLLLAGCALDDPQASFERAIVSAAESRWPEAHEQVRRALRARPRHLPSRILAGLCHHHARQPERALDAFRGAAQDAPDDFAAQHFYGWMLAEMGKHGEALAPLRRAHELRPDDVDTLTLLARCSLEQNLPEGIDYLTRLRRFPTYQKAPNDRLIDNNLALLHLYQGDRTRAKNHMLAALKRDPASPVIAQNVGILYDQYLGEPEAAVRYYAMALVNSQKVGDREREARLRRRLNELAAERKLKRE